VNQPSDGSRPTSLPIPSLVSIILPTFNRARFLPEAFGSIRSQRWAHWELIVIDDGSTDGTRELVEQARSDCEKPIRYVFQENRGAYAARNTGLDHANGKYVAFFDSDDLWLPEYLERCVTALDAQHDVDWVFAACRMVDDSTGGTIALSTFQVNNEPRPFLALRTRDAGALRIVDDPAAALICQLTSGLHAGLQNSVIRKQVFEKARFWDDYRVVEDVLYLVRALSAGLRIGYIDEVLVIYRVHDDNSSASATGGSAARLLPIFQEEVRGLERIRQEVPLTAEVRRVLERQLGAKYFWRLGYAGFWQAGLKVEALQAFRTGLRLRSLDWRMWKTYALCRLRTSGRA
jgi:glycosyltransferase involved in cell wall biosynthesis